MFLEYRNNSSVNSHNPYASAMAENHIKMIDAAKMILLPLQNLLCTKLLQLFMPMNLTVKNKGFVSIAKLNAAIAIANIVHHLAIFPCQNGTRENNSKIISTTVKNITNV
eukprot:TRINITY_DN21658_c0_g1_i1.p2 TRINITY_DN21658_c0_g1~~TRINITY_DN21658_c0_g1_i1.p2  ORF type:complete len:110 (-),score=8.77 TRINITY_DN21658_c0_g1_i1:309-638(-)